MTALIRKSELCTRTLQVTLAVFIFLWTSCGCSFVSVTHNAARGLSTDAKRSNDNAAMASMRNINSTDSDTTVAKNTTDNIHEETATAAVVEVKSTVELPISANDTSYSVIGLAQDATFDLKAGGALLRAFCVTMALTLVVVVYFAVKAVRLRRRRNKSHKYGIVSTNGDLELTPFDMHEDDDETTVFEVATNHA